MTIAFPKPDEALLARREDESYLGFEDLTQLRRHRLAELALGSSPVDDRDDLGSP